MCGIIAYTGEREAIGVLLAGLRCLEYRGYDSAGVAVMSQERPPSIAVRRAAGALRNLETEITRAPVAGVSGIGHTRWATHGQPTARNAHPHLDCSRSFAVVHNGMLANAGATRRKLQEKGHRLASDTDSEVFAHLLEEAYADLAQTEGSPIELARIAQRAFRLIDGAHAIVCSSLHHPDSILAVRLGYAGGLVVGYGKGEILVASDVVALVGLAPSAVQLEDRDVLVASPQRAYLWRLDDPFDQGEGVTAFEKRVRIPVREAAMPGKAGYQHYTLKEIHDQPVALKSLLEHHIEPGELLDRRNTESSDNTSSLPKVDRLVFVGCGTPRYAALVGKQWVESLAGIVATVEYAHEFAHSSPPLSPTTLVVAVTQSGETADVLLAIENARRRGAKVMVITNREESAAVRMADFVMYMFAGMEIGVAETKTFTAQLCALLLLALELGTERGVLAPEAATEVRTALQFAPGLVSQILSRPVADYQRYVDLFNSRPSSLFLGRGLQYPIALEGALKLKELSYLHAEGYPAGEMKHGPIALIDDGYPVVALVGRDSERDRMLSQIAQVQSRGARVLAIATDGDDVQAVAEETCLVPPVHPLVAPIVMAIPLQLLAYYVAVQRGADPDHPRNLAKSVTVE